MSDSTPSPAAVAAAAAAAKLHRWAKKEATIYDAFRGATEADAERALEYIHKGGCLTEFDENKMTLLHHAAFGGNMVVVRAVVDAVNGTGASAGAVPQKIGLDAGDSDGWAPLHYAADRGHATAIALLVEEAGANINARDDSKRTPLHLAALRGRVEAVQVLLAASAMRGAKNITGMTPLECAAAADQKAVVALFA